MRKIFSSVLVMVFGLFFVSSINLKADTPIVKATDGASIRAAEGEVKQGLRFYAKLNGEAEEHGFYLVFGEATVGELQTALDEQGRAEFATLNGKDVFRVVVPGVTQDNEFSVVLTDIPKDKGYLQQISVFPFAVDNGVETIVESVTRSVAEVALKAANAGEDIGDVITDLQTNVKRLGMNAFGELELTGNMYETNHFLLREEFIKDWNTKFGTTWNSLVPGTFFTSAKSGLGGTEGANKDIKDGNLYKFFNDEFYGDKWDWLLTHIQSVDGTTHPSRQIVAVRGNGTNGDYLLYHGNQLSYAIANFFNQTAASGGYPAIDFTVITRYNNVKTNNTRITIDFAKYLIGYVNSQVMTITAPEKEGYDFVHYKLGELELNENTSYTVPAEDKLFELIYQIINYNLEFYDGETKIDDLSTTYTINDNVSLPNYVKDGFVFEGWYDNPELDGSPISSILKGSTGVKKFYAKTVASEASGSITYNLNGGNFYSYRSREELVSDFMTDFNAYFSGKDDIEASRFQLDTYGWNVFTIFSNATYGSKWIWMRTYIIQVATNQNHGSLNGLNSNDDATWRGSIDSFLNETVRTGWPSSADYTNEPAKNGFWSMFEIEAPVVYEHGYEVTLLTPMKVGFTFGGWYLEDDFSGTAITKISEESTGDVVLYAKWE